MASKIVQLDMWANQKEQNSDIMDEKEFQKMLRGSLRALFAENYSLKKGYKRIADHCEVVEATVFELRNRVDRLSDEVVKHV